MVSFIISYRQKDQYRKINLNYLVKWLRGLNIQDMEIIVVEQDIREKYKNKHIIKVFAENKSIFNKGKGCNIGSKIANNNLLFFNDCDIIMPRHNYFDALKQIIDYDIINPYGSIYYYTEADSVRFMNDPYRIGHYSSKVKPSIISGGAFLIRKSVFKEMGGFDEACIGFGYEDTIFDVKIQKLNYKVKTLKDNYSMHLYHPAPTPMPKDWLSFNKFVLKLEGGDSYYSNFKQNKLLYETYMQMSVDELKKKIHDSSFNLGNQ